MRVLEHPRKSRTVTPHGNRPCSSRTCVTLDEDEDGSSQGMAALHPPSLRVGGCRGLPDGPPPSSRTTRATPQALYNHSLPEAKSSQLLMGPQTGEFRQGHVGTTRSAHTRTHPAHT